MPADGSRTRIRRLEGRLPLSRYRQHVHYGDGSLPDGYIVDNATYGADFTGTQVTESESHDFHSLYRKGKLKGDLGGPFRTTKSFLASKPGVHRIKIVESGQFHTTYTTTFEGPVLPGLPSHYQQTQFPPSHETSDEDLENLGATAIARCAPGNPPAEVATFLGELFKDGLPALIGSKAWSGQTSAAKAAGSEYLNLQFGWMPLVKDVKSFANAIIKADDVLTQLERDAGRVVRRRFAFPTKYESSQVTMATDIEPSFFVGGNKLLGTTPKGNLVRSRVIERRQWFSGAFTYYLPTGYDSRNGMVSTAARARALLGLSLTPDVLWELTPWSWAIDWFSNTSDVIKNVRRFETGGLVLRYGYMMEHTIVSDTWTLSGANHLIGLPAVQPLVLVTETKKRVKANPFGFGVSWDGLSSFQASILAALGITRLGR